VCKFSAKTGDPYKDRLCEPQDYAIFLNCRCSITIVYKKLETEVHYVGVVLAWKNDVAPILAPALTPILCPTVYIEEIKNLYKIFYFFTRPTEWVGAIARTGAASYWCGSSIKNDSAPVLAPAPTLLPYTVKKSHKIFFSPYRPWDWDQMWSQTVGTSYRCGFGMK
jgi:hypothetical protein